MIGIFTASLLLQCLAVVLAIRLNWVYRQHRSWWLISGALFLMTVHRATSFYQFLQKTETAPRSLIGELLSLNISVLLVVGLWLLDPLFRSIQKANQILEVQKRELSELVKRRALEMGEQIGERKRAEQAERDLYALYHSLVETLPMSIIRKDREGRFVFVNQAACQMLNRKQEDILRKTDRELFELPLAQKYRHDDLSVMESGETIEDVEEFRDPGGEPKQVQILKTPVYNARNEIVGTQVIFWDVTESRQAIEALARSDSIKTAMFEAALECIITIDGDDRILEFNPASSKAFGYDRKEVKGKRMAELLIPEASRDRHNANMEKYLGSGVVGSLMLGRLAVPMQRKDGSQFTAELSMQPIPLDDSTGFTVFLRDITERQRAEKELARRQQLIEQANTDLQVEVQERRRAEQESEMRNRDLKTLLYVISHDLREPLRGVRNFANLIQDRYADKLDDRGRDFLSRIIRAAERLDRQLEDVLMLSRAQRLIDPKEQIALNEVVVDVLRQLELRIQETQANVTVEDNLPRVWADRTWAVQAVLNLVSNALKFTQPDATPDISICGFQSNGEGLHQSGLVVSDRGPGIPPEHVNRIFDLFQRAVGRDIEGTGAGLSIVRRIAERHGGEVKYQPRDGGGAEFWLGFGEPPDQ